MGFMKQGERGGDGSIMVVAVVVMVEVRGESGEEGVGVNMLLVLRRGVVGLVLVSIVVLCGCGGSRVEFSGGCCTRRTSRILATSDINIDMGRQQQ